MNAKKTETSAFTRPENIETNKPEEVEVKELSTPEPKVEEPEVTIDPRVDEIAAMTPVKKPSSKNLYYTPVVTAEGAIKLIKEYGLYNPAETAATLPFLAEGRSFSFRINRSPLKRVYVGFPVATANKDKIILEEAITKAIKDAGLDLETAMKSRKVGGGEAISTMHVQVNQDGTPGIGAQVRTASPVDVLNKKV